MTKKHHTPCEALKTLLSRIPDSANDGEMKKTMENAIKKCCEEVKTNSSAVKVLKCVNEMRASASSASASLASASASLASASASSTSASPASASSASSSGKK
ncbi:hypothetical protein Rs2_23044 [Raphanus sativus]|nr:hypothetical protein Rs2_23044 [Raphanus sativus]